MRTGVYETQLAFDVVLDRAGEEWVKAAREAVLVFCRADVAFTADEVRMLAGDPPVPNALGALLNDCVKSHLIRELGTVRSRRPEAHGRKVTKWGRA